MSSTKKMLSMVLLPLLLIGCGAALAALGGRDLLRARASDSWPETPGRIKVSEIEEDYRTSNGDTTCHYVPKLRYEYAVDGKQYEGAMIFFGDATSTVRADVEQIVEPYPVGREVKVRYLPEEPEVAVLEPGVRSSVYLLPAVGGVLIGVGLLFPLMVGVSAAFQTRQSNEA